MKPCSLACFCGLVRGRRLLAQHAIDEFGKLGTQTVEYALEQRRLDVPCRLVQERISQLQCFRQYGRLHGLVVE